MLVKIGILILTLLACTVIRAQVLPQIKLTIEQSQLIRGRTAIVDVRVQIPESYFVPAETHGSLQGAWLQAMPPWMSREMPTYPVPDAAVLPGSERAVLAYSGTFAIHLPVDVPEGVRGRNDFRVRFTHQLCDSRRCAAVTISTAQTAFDVQEAVPADSPRLAYRADSQRVAIVTDMKDRVNPKPPDLIHLVARMVPPMFVIPENERARSRFSGRFALGGRWSIASNGARFTAVAAQPAAISWGCEGPEAPLAVIARVADAAFLKERAKYFLASPNGNPSPQQSSSVELQLDGAHRRELEEVIDRQMRVTVPTLFAPDPFVRNDNAQLKETDYDRRVRDGQGRLVYHSEAFSLAPDGNPRLYVRAYWRVGESVQTGLTLWLRFEGQHFFVEHTDASVSRLARYLELKEFGIDLAAKPEFAGMLLNVIPSADGWAFVIMGRRGYESTGVSVWKYSPVGPRDTGLRYVYGC
jgi:hypothetical protein